MILIRYIFRLTFFLIIMGVHSMENIAQQPVEICDNGIDDDGDQATDLVDSDCACEVIAVRSLIPNPSFEQMDCCPELRAQLTCASIWQQASGPSTDYIHSCGWMGWPEFPPPFPFPDGDGIIGFRDGVQDAGLEPELYWKEYVGACLSSPLLEGEEYKLIFDVGFVTAAKSPPIEMTLYGSFSCNKLPFGGSDVDLGCPLNEEGWEILDYKVMNGGSGKRWVTDTLTFIPTSNVYTIVFGPPCEYTQADQSTYYFLDNLRLAASEKFDFDLQEIGDQCDPDFRLEIPIRPENQYQWYRNKIAMVGETSNVLVPMGREGTFTVRVINENGCFLSEDYVFNLPEDKIFLDEFICEGESFTFGNRTIYEQGTYIDTIKRESFCDSIVSVNLFILPPVEKEIRLEIFPGESINIDGRTFSGEGTYQYSLTSSAGCDSLITLYIDYINFFYPNAFSPNEDGINDFLTLSGDLQQVQSSEMMIFDRWGNKLFQGEMWDGYFSGNPVPSGVYVIIATIKSIRGKETIYTGNVTVVN